MSFKVFQYKNGTVEVNGEGIGGTFGMSLYRVDRLGAASGMHEFTDLERKQLEQYVNAALQGVQSVLEKANKRIAEEGAWVDALTSMDYEVGDKVYYQPTHYGNRYENGIVKDVRPDDDGCWVVYNCLNDWDNYKNYTAAKTNYRDLKRGWCYD